MYYRAQLMAIMFSIYRLANIIAWFPHKFDYFVDEDILTGN